MSQYTEMLEVEAETLQPDEDDYEKRLLEVASFFRSFDDAFTVFLIEHGYKGAPENEEEKLKYLREKFSKSGVPLHRNYKTWFQRKNPLDRDIVFSICFAFGLNVSETDDFFRRVQLDRSFDCHKINEIVYYFCIKNGLNYSDAQEIISQIPKPEKTKTIPAKDALYTKTIKDFINSIDDREKLIQYLSSNIRDFSYNNTTAIEFIRNIWEQIRKEKGLAEQEGCLIENINRAEDKNKKGDTDTRSKEVIEQEVNREKEYRLDDYVITKNNASTWTIFSQILGLDNGTADKYATIPYNRSIKKVLDNNKLMPLRASDCFPSQENIDSLLRGEMGDNEKVRKMLIFLVFYSYWVKKNIASNNVYYVANLDDTKRCLDRINKYLRDAGYPSLYAGNPYDWLFLWSMNDDCPLNAFRTYIGEVFSIKSEQDSVY